MKLLRFFTIPLIGLLVIATATLAQDVKTDYDHHANFSQYRTYYWERVKTTDPLWQSRIQDAVDHELQAKGWQRVDNGGDVALAAVGSTHNQQEYQTFYNGMGRLALGWFWRNYDAGRKLSGWVAGPGFLRYTQQAIDLARSGSGIAFG